MWKVMIAGLSLLFFSMGYAKAVERPLPADKAFVLTGAMTKDAQLVLHWEIAPGYYLYREKMKIEKTSANTAKIGEIVLPQGLPRQDVLHGKFQAYEKRLTVILPLAERKGLLDFTMGYQGCSSAGFCYTPIKKVLKVDLTQLKPTQNISEFITQAAALNEASVSNQGYATQLLSGHHYVLIVLGFLLLGLLLAFTPCVLPMVPILSSIIVGYGNKLSSKKAFSLSLAYVLGMAIAYAAAGMIVALVGSSIQVELQKTWIIVLLSGLFVLLALSLFGLYEIRLPNSIQQKLVTSGNRLKGGAYFSVFLMGVFSTLIVSPCVSAPLVGVLAYIASSGDVLLGGVALLALGIGMGVPLLLIGASAGKLLPKAGEWMDVVKHLFGLMMLGMAIWMLARVLPQGATLFLWAILAIISGLYIKQLKRSKRIWRHLHHGFGLIIVAYGLVLLAGAIIGQSDPLYLFQAGEGTFKPNKPEFYVVKSMSDLDQRLAQAKSQQQLVLLDFYADWCASCVIMDRTVFAKHDIQAKLKKFILLRADVTQDNAFDQALLKRFNVVAPPTMIFFDTNGMTLLKHEVVGEVDAKQFLAAIEEVEAGKKS